MLAAMNQYVHHSRRVGAAMPRAMPARLPTHPPPRVSWNATFEGDAAPGSATVDIQVATASAGFGGVPAATYQVRPWPQGAAACRG